MKHDLIAIGIVSALLLIYTVFAMLEVFIGFVLLIVGLSPVFIIWMVYTVLKHGEFNGRELDEEEEYGYQHY